jgi:hypothetical protein
LRDSGTRREALVLDLAVVAMCAYALARGWLATRGLSWPCDVDLYRDIGFAQSMADGRPWADPLYLGEWLWYPPLVPGLAALTSLLSGLPVHVTATQLGVYLNLLAPAAFYLLCLRLFGRRVSAAATLAFLFIGLGDFPTWASASYSPWLFPSNFVQGLFYLGLLCLHTALTRGPGASLRWWLAAGGMLGLCALGHSAPALVLGGVAALAAGWRLVSPGPVPRRRTLLGAGAMFALAFVVALPYTASILFHYGLQVENQAPSSWTFFRLDLRTLDRFARDLLSPSLALPALGYLGVVIAAPPRRRWARRLVWLWLAVALGLFAYSYLHQWLKTQGITAPVSVPAHHFHIYLKALEALFIGGALYLAARALSGTAGWLGRRLGRRASAGADRWRDLFALGCVMALAGALSHLPYTHRDDFTGEPQKAKILTPTEDMADMFRWIRSNTNPDDVFLANDHLSLHLLSPAGRKVVAMIPFFSNPFVPWRQRHEDRAQLFTALTLGNEAAFQPLAARHQLGYMIERGALAVKLYGSSMPFLEVAHRAGDFWLFRVKRREPVLD